MRTNTRIFSFLIIGLLVAILVHCKAYDPVRRPPNYIRSESRIMLHKDQLRFRLNDVVTRSDTLYGRAEPTVDEPSGRNRMIVVLKSGEQPDVDSNGRMIIPYTSVDYVESYELNKKKSGRMTAITILVTMSGVFLIAVSLAAPF